MTQCIEQLEQSSLCFGNFGFPISSTFRKFVTSGIDIGSSNVVGIAYGCRLSRHELERDCPPIRCHTIKVLGPESITSKSSPSRLIFTAWPLPTMLPLEFSSIVLPNHMLLEDPRPPQPCISRPHRFTLHLPLNVVPTSFYLLLTYNTKSH